MVSEMHYGNALCSGSLVNQQSVLTSASCIEGAAGTTIFLGAHDLTSHNDRYQVKLHMQPAHYVIHPDYVRHQRVLNNDVGIIRIGNRIAFFTNAVNFVSLPLASDLNNLFQNTPSIIMG